jgi:hypothetical protein
MSRLEEIDYFKCNFSGNKEKCFYFNAAICFNEKCKRVHLCFICDEDHKVINCDKIRFDKSSCIYYNFGKCFSNECRRAHRCCCCYLNHPFRICGFYHEIEAYKRINERDMKILVSYQETIESLKREIVMLREQFNTLPEEGEVKRDTLDHHPKYSNYNKVEKYKRVREEKVSSEMYALYPSRKKPKI